LLIVFNDVRVSQGSDDASELGKPLLGAGGLEIYIGDAECKSIYHYNHDNSDSDANGSK
jgi:hypothetical protein